MGLSYSSETLSYLKRCLDTPERRMKREVYCLGFGLVDVKNY